MPGENDDLLSQKMSSPNPTTHPRTRKWHFLLLSFLLFCSFAAIGIASYFRLGPDTAALRSSFLKVEDVPWNRKIAIHIGPLTMAMFRHAVRFIDMGDEPKAVIESLRSIEVGVYELPISANENALTSLDAADKAVASRKWQRVVSVKNEEAQVAIYAQTPGVSAKAVRCCFMVLHERLLIVGSARINPESLMRLATWTTKIESHDSM
jgi:hypothetical protein